MTNTYGYLWNILIMTLAALLFSLSALSSGVKTMKGDLLALAEHGHFDVIIHGCNCQSSMSGGIAAQIAQKFPAAMQADKTSPMSPQKKLGQYSCARIKRADGSVFYVVNAYTQAKGGKVKDKTALYENIEQALKSVKKDFKGDHYRIGMPEIGSGIAGGDSVRIANIIDKVFDGENVTIVKYDKDQVPDDVWINNDGQDRGSDTKAVDSGKALAIGGAMTLAAGAVIAGIYLYKKSQNKKTARIKKQPQKAG